MTRKVSAGGLEIPYVERVKHLGVYLDKELLWGPHLKIQCRKVLKIFMQCRTVIGIGLRPEPHEALWIHEVILKPKITYAAVV